MVVAAAVSILAAVVLVDCLVGRPISSLAKAILFWLALEALLHPLLMELAQTGTIRYSLEFLQLAVAVAAVMELTADELAVLEAVALLMAVAALVYLLQ